VKLLIYGTFPANDAGKITRHLRHGWDVSVVFDPDPVERKAALLAETDVMVTSAYRAGDPPAPHLRLLQCSSTGTDNIALDRLPPGCIFCNVYGHEIAIAEYVVCAILDWSIGYRGLTGFAGEWSMARTTARPSAKSSASSASAASDARARPAPGPSA
jgi:phosphoglycerate dehydrogenase-like enzyme